MDTTGDFHPSESKAMEIPRSNFICAVTFNLADGKTIFGGGYDGCVRQWKVEDGEEVGCMNANDGLVVCLASSRDGKWVVVGTESGLVTVWDAVTQSSVLGFRGHSSFAVETLDVSPDGTRIATGSSDATACTWSLSNGERQLGPLQHDSTLAVVKYSHDGALLATATCDTSSVRVYKNEDGQLLVDIPVRVDINNQSLVWSANNVHLFALSDGKIKRLDMRTGTTLSEWSIHSENDPRGIALLPSNNRFIAAAANSSISFWDTTTHQQIGPVLEHADVLFSMDISSNYDFVTSGVKSTIIRSLREILPSSYCEDTHFEPEPEVLHDEGEHTSLEETIKSLCTEMRHLRTEQENSRQTIVKLEETIQELRTALIESQRKADQANYHLCSLLESLCPDFRPTKMHRVEF